MRAPATYMALSAASPALAAYAGFNYGSTFTTGAAKVQSDFESEFTTAQGLISAPTVFNSARLYTMIVSYDSSADHTAVANSHHSKAEPQTPPLKPFQPPSVPKPPCFLVCGAPPVTLTSPMKLLL